MTNKPKLGSSLSVTREAANILADRFGKIDALDKQANEVVGEPVPAETVAGGGESMMPPEGAAADPTAAAAAPPPGPDPMSMMMEALTMLGESTAQLVDESRKQTQLLMAMAGQQSVQEGINNSLTSQPETAAPAAQNSAQPKVALDLSDDDFDEYADEDDEDEEILGKVAEDDGGEWVDQSTQGSASVPEGDVFSSLRSSFNQAQTRAGAIGMLRAGRQASENL